jgi:actin-like ATPase involved in cell morphogenesis
MANTTGKKYGGRKKGTPNKSTKEIKEALQAVINSEIETLPELFKELTPQQRVEAITRFIAYVVPKADSSEVNNHEKPIFNGIDLNVVTHIIPKDLRKHVYDKEKPIEHEDNIKLLT